MGVGCSSYIDSLLRHCGDTNSWHWIISFHLAITGIWTMACDIIDMLNRYRLKRVIVQVKSISSGVKSCPQFHIAQSMNQPALMPIKGAFKEFGNYRHVTFIIRGQLHSYKYSGLFCTTNLQAHLQSNHFAIARKPIRCCIFCDHQKVFWLSGS